MEKTFICCSSRLNEFYVGQEIEKSGKFYRVTFIYIDNGGDTLNIIAKPFAK